STSNRSEEHTSELQSHLNLVCRLLLEKKKVSPSHALASSAACNRRAPRSCTFFFFNDTPTTEIYTLSLHDALPISSTSNIRASPTIWSATRCRRRRRPSPSTL